MQIYIPPNWQGVMLVVTVWAVLLLSYGCVFQAGISYADGVKYWQLHQEEQLDD